MVMVYAIKTGMVKLSEEDMEWAFQVGDERWQDCIDNNRKTRHGNEQEDARFDDRIGAAGELAFARLNKLEWPAHVGMFLSANNTEADRDVPPYEVRLRTRKKIRQPDLMLRKTDIDAPYAMVIHEREAFFKIVGFIFMARVRANHEKYWKKVRNIKDPAFFVPQKDLADFDYQTKQELDNSQPAG